MLDEWYIVKGSSKEVIVLPEGTERAQRNNVVISYSKIDLFLLQIPKLLNIAKYFDRVMSCSLPKKYPITAIFSLLLNSYAHTPFNSLPNYLNID